jgi:4-diphosphocytidyl-2-C-methyl-D-erythritol kinase
MPITETARAKVNLTLTVLGRRPDGYHELESLVTFADIADRVTLLPGPACTVTMTGPFAGDVAGQNLLERALLALNHCDPRLQLGAVHLEKNLPVAAGLGGGSADTAALLRAVRRANPERAPAIAWRELAARLGADVPVCLEGQPAFMRGIGNRIETVTRGHSLPAVAVVLANPRLALPTARVFAALGARPAPLGDALIDSAVPFRDLQGLLDFMQARGNDLERTATTLLPVIAEVKMALSKLPGCRLAALSGSGPTCFGIFGSDDGAAHAARLLAAEKGDWWIVPTRLAGTTA